MPCKKQTLIFIFLLSLFRANAQQPFRLHSPEEYITGSLLLGMNIGGNYLYNHKVPLTEEAILKLDRTSLNAFDRNATFHYSRSARLWSDRLLLSSLFFPLALLADKTMRNEATPVIVIALESTVLTSMEIQFVKGLAQRPRPFMYNPEVPMEIKRNRDATASFFSGHTAMTATLSFYSARMITAYHPDKKRDPFIWAGAALVPAATGYLRFKAGKHYPTDILTGLLIGALNGVLVAELHR